MAIQTDSYFSVMYGDEEVDKIGLSDTLDNYTAEDIQAYMLCGCRDKLLGGNFGLYDYGGGSYDVWNTGTPFGTGTVDYTYMHMLNGNGDNSTADLQGRYCGTVLLTDSLLGFPMSIKAEDLSRFQLITELDIKNYCMDISATLTQKGGIGATQLSDKTNTLYCVDITLASLYYRYGTPPVDVPVSLAVVPYLVFEIAGELFLVNGYKTNKLGFSCRLAPNRNAGLEIYPISSSSDEASYSLAFNCIGFGDDYSDYSANTYAWAYGNDTVNKFGGTDGGVWYQCYFGILMFDVRYYYTSYDQMMMQFANTGLLFKVDGIIYKPLISDNVVYGYTDNLDTPSDIDNWERDTKHDVPITPPTPPTPPLPPGDDMESMATGATGSSGGFTHFYVMSPQDLIDFLADFYTRASSGETLTNNLVCSYILGIPSSEFCATEEVEIAIHNSAQGTPFVSQAKYSHITATNNLLVVGSFNVPRITNTFYDFAPYSTYEVFIPCCGWVALPDTVAGRSINVEIYIDIASCCLKAAVKTNDLGVCAVTNGVLGAAIPIAVIESGILRGNNIQAGLGIIGGGINTGVGAGSGNAMGIGFGVQQILNGLVECTIAGNTNYTQQKGGTGDITQFAMGHKCYMKVTHPDIDPVVNNSIFGHSVGYLCNSIGKLETFKGFTVCGNPHVTFSASAEEREEIERLLSIGVIL